ncbi:glycosyltransferase family 2 protein [Microbacterium sp. SORGH_AS_0862]|uniref:glycosyltransferase family 2 protein n=1 Tax=Microbacterium sp. SORGH_AS_0862 TaxID=3041789 RepID=UPI00278FD2F1|nr:glycosyltransferase family 2 protein [Microbacterium sp. SORGH_AS_0862]MDQ1205538.1 cellulose synthase (UDP-forming) [Microbacterium sp. SORGH_AS_0862]
MAKTPALPSARRRQWGSERRREPLPTLHPRPSAAKIVWARVAIAITVAGWAAYMLTTALRQIFAYDGEHIWPTIEACIYALVITALSFSALMFLVQREAALRRFRDHDRVPRAELDRHFDDEHGEGMTVLIPSYAEEPSVIRKTMWSAALQEYPSLRVVLLLDDPPFPTDPHTLARLEATRQIALGIAEDLAEPAYRFTEAMFDFEQRAATDGVGEAEILSLRDEYRYAVAWLNDMADSEPHEDHVDTFFIDQVLRGLADDLDLTASALESAAGSGTDISHQRLHELHRRLVWIFSVDVGTFERKRYASLSNEANKAMNLNAYIGLMGGRYRFVEGPGRKTVLRLVAGAGQEADLVIPNSDYLLTLDADSLLLRDYCLRLVYFLEQPGNERVAVTQTPYSSFRGAPTRIERLAGATTDIQHILHQGMSGYDATFWVGANAVIRMEAMDDIMQIDDVDGFEVRRYVQDRTVIEDTESSVDLADHNWTLVNYPERLSYSATPPDFGSLVVQRRRWANGGLLILPKFLRQVRARRRSSRPVRLGEWMIRVNYMASLAWASFALLFLLTFPFDSDLLSPLVLVAAAPYFLCQASDLKYSGYRYLDILRIYGFNLILLPVNLAGVLKSIEQGLTGRKIPFARTPKVRERTATTLLYVVAPWAIVAFSIFTAWWSFNAQNWGTFFFGTLNAVCALWACVENIGIRNSLVDVWMGLTNWMWVPVPTQTAGRAAPGEPGFDWQDALFHGYPAAGDPVRRAARPTASAAVEQAPSRALETRSATGRRA